MKMNNPQEEILRAWENIKLISNPAWITKTDDYIKANQRLWSWKCTQECHDHLYKDIHYNRFEINNEDSLHCYSSQYILDSDTINCRRRSVRETIPQSRLAKYYGNFFYDESRECLYSEAIQSITHTTTKLVTFAKDDVTPCWMLPEVDYWFKMLTENDYNLSSQELKTILTEHPIRAQKVDTNQQVMPRMSITTTNICEASCLFNEKTIKTNLRETLLPSEKSLLRDDILEVFKKRDVPKWIIYLDHVYPDLQLSMHFQKKIPVKRFSFYSTQIHKNQETTQCKIVNKFPMQLNTEDEKRVYEKIFSSFIQNIWKCEYCSSKNCTETSHANVKRPNFYFTPESISALQKSIIDFRAQIKSCYPNDLYSSPRQLHNAKESRKIRHDKRRFKNKALNKCKSQKETKYLEHNVTTSTSSNATEHIAENSMDDNCPNQTLKKFFDHFRNAANTNLIQNTSYCSNQYNASNSLPSMFVINASHREQNGDFTKGHDKTMKSVSSQTYSNEITTTKQTNKPFKNNKTNQNKTTAKRKVSSDKNAKTSLAGSFSSVKTESYNSSSDAKKTNQNTNSNNKGKNSQTTKRKSSNKRKTVPSIEPTDKTNSNIPRKITILNKPQNMLKHDEDGKSKKLPTAQFLESDKQEQCTDVDVSDLNNQHNISKACGGEAFIQNYTLAQSNENKCATFKEDPALSYRKRLYSDVLSGNSSVLLLHNDTCNLSQINTFKLDESHNIDKTQCTEIDFNPMIILNRNTTSNVVDVSSIEAQFEKLEIEALEQYKTSDESIDKKFDELEKEAIAQYVDTSDSYTSCKDEGDTSNKTSSEIINENKERENTSQSNKNTKEAQEADKTKTVNSFVIYSKASNSNRKTKSSKKCKTQKQ